MSKIRVALIGCGMLARSQHIPNIANLSKMILHTCCDLSDEALAEYKEKPGSLYISNDYKAVINDPEIDALCCTVSTKMGRLFSRDFRRF